MSGLRNLWWQTLLLSLALFVAAVFYYWSVGPSGAGGLSGAVQGYISNWPVVTLFFALAAASLWFRVRTLPNEERARREALNRTALIALVLGLSGLLFVVGILAWETAWPSPRAMAEAFAYPPLFVSGSVSLMVGGVALSFASWPPRRRNQLLRVFERVGLVALVGFLPMVVWGQVVFLHIDLQIAAISGLLIFTVSLLTLLIAPRRLSPSTGTPEPEKKGSSAPRQT